MITDKRTGLGTASLGAWGLLPFSIDLSGLMVRPYLNRSNTMCIPSSIRDGNLTIIPVIYSIQLIQRCIPR